VSVRPCCECGGPSPLGYDLCDVCDHAIGTEWPIALGHAIARFCRRADVAGLVDRVGASLACVRPDWPTDAFDALDRLARLAGGGA